MVFNKENCIICLEKCTENICECNAYIHNTCLEKWNDSIYNVNQKTCPHCRREIILRETILNKIKFKENDCNCCNCCNCCKKILNDICKCFNTIYNYFITFIHKLYKLFINIIIKLYYVCLFTFCFIFIPTLLGIIMYSINYYYYSNIINYSYKDYIFHNIIAEWLLGFILLITILHIWAKCKMGNCRLDDDW